MEGKQKADKGARTAKKVEETATKSSDLVEIYFF